MFKFLNLQPEIFGLDISDSALRIVKLKKRKGGFYIVSHNEISIKKDVLKERMIQDQATLADTIKNAIKTVKGRKLNTKYVIASLPEEKSFFQIIQMPKMTEQEIGSALPFEIENYIPLPVDKVYLDFQVINHKKSNPNSLDVLVSVMPKSIVESYVSCFKKAGLIPCILEVESQAITRALIRKEINYPLIIIDIGEFKTNFTIYSDNSLRFTSSIPFNSRQLTDAILNNLGFSFKEAERIKIKYGLTAEGEKKYNIIKAMSPFLKELVDHTKKYISFYQTHLRHNESTLTSGKFKKVVLCGGGANLKDFPNFLSKKLGIPVELGNPLVNIYPENKKDIHNISSQKILSFTTALGLAIRGAIEEN